MSHSPRAAIAVVCVASTLSILLVGAPARACGCFSPPLPEGVTDFAVNQQAEQIIFEVLDEETVAAHVMIRYAGAPEAFAWLVPVPSVPALELSESMPFALLETATRPNVNVSTVSACPSAQYRCAYHDSCWEPPSDVAGSADEGGGDAGDGVTILQQAIIGSYDTVVFGADEADAAVEWLLTNDFIVNESMTPYMQPYLDGGMLFVAAKLVPGAGVEEIKPLKMTYEHAGPIIPLRLTAVAAEPHLAVTSWIFADSPFAPRDQPLTTVDSARITMDTAGRVNYPMVLSRTVDEAGGDAFVVEYAGPPSDLRFHGDDPGGCCSDSWDDFCFAGFDGVCQCPGTEWDAEDCLQIEGLGDGLAFLDELGARFTTLTRLTTRLSAEDMTFDPVFEAAADVGLSGRLQLTGTRRTLTACQDAILDLGAYANELQRIDCASIYCGAGECVGTHLGAGCVCDAGYVVRRFTDLDGADSITCVPDIGTVDFGLGLDVALPDACADQTVAGGDCWEVGGFPASDCGDKAGVLSGSGELARCEDVVTPSDSPGAEDFSDSLTELEVCWPAVPTCGESGWLEDSPNIWTTGTDCGAPAPAASLMVPPPGPDCDGDGEPDDAGGDADTGDGGGGGSGDSPTTDVDDDGCSAAAHTHSTALLLFLLLVLAAGSRRRALRDSSLR